MQSWGQSIIQTTGDPVHSNLYASSGPIFYLWQSKVSANERRRYICNVFFQWLRPCSTINKNGLWSRRVKPQINRDPYMAAIVNEHVFSFTKRWLNMGNRFRHANDSTQLGMSGNVYKFSDAVAEIWQELVNQPKKIYIRNLKHVWIESVWLDQCAFPSRGVGHVILLLVPRFLVESRRPFWLVDIGSGNGLVPLGTKPLPEPMLTYIDILNSGVWSAKTFLKSCMS